MSIGNAKTFIKTAMNTKTLRTSINAATNAKGVQQVLATHGTPFTYSEFDEAYHNLLIECQHEEQAEQLKELKMWWDLTMSMIRE